MTTKWLLYLVSALLIALIYVYLGWAIEQNPDGSLAAGLGLRSKTLREGLAHNPALRRYAQTLYGSAGKKGGFALAVLSVLGMLCVLNQSDQAVTIAAAVIFLVEILFFFALRAWCIKKTEERFPSSNSNPSSSEEESAHGSDVSESSPDTGESGSSQSPAEEHPLPAAQEDTPASDADRNPEESDGSKPDPAPLQTSFPDADDTDLSSTDRADRTALKDGPLQAEDAASAADENDADDSNRQAAFSSSDPLLPVSAEDCVQDEVKALICAEEMCGPAAPSSSDLLLEETDPAAAAASDAALFDPAFSVLDSSGAQALADLQTRLNLSFEQAAEKPHLHRADRHPAVQAVEEEESEAAGQVSFRSLAASWNGPSGAH